VKRPFWYLRRRSDVVSSEVDEELAAHLDMMTKALEARGWSRDAARSEALRRFGDLQATRRYCQQQDRAKEQRMERRLWFDDLRQDIRVCVRNLLRVPGLALTIVITVGIGIGATTAMFAIIHATLIRPLPYEDSGRLVRIYTDSPPNKWPFSVADYLTLQEQQTRFANVGGYVEQPMTFTDGSTAERLNGRVVSWTLFDVLKLHPGMGRSFNEADGRPGAPPVVIVSHGFWSQRLGGRPDALGKAVRLGGVDYRLVGVLPERTGPLENGRQLFVAAQWSTPPRKGPFSITLIARLRSEADRAAAVQELRQINRRMFPIWRTSYQDERATWGMVDLKTHVLGEVGSVLLLALAAVALAWSIACANAANLLIARVAGRQRELAVRSALGASRGRVLRYLFAESSVLAVGAALLGGAIAWTAIAVLRSVALDYVPRSQELALDGPVRWVLAATTAASALMFGLVPSLFGTRAPVAESLKTLGRSSTGSPASHRLRRGLVAAQFAIATPLLIVAGLLAGSLSQLGRVDLGFDDRNLVTGLVALPPAQYREPGRVAAFWTEFQRRLEALPGVAAVAFADGRPPNEVNMVNNFDLEASPTPAGQSQPTAPWVAATPDYFRLLGLTLVQGRLLDERDAQENSDPAVVVDRAWAERYFPQGSAVGARFHEGGCTSCPWLRVVGVVSNVKYVGLDKPDDGTVYWPLTGSRPFRYLIVRTREEPTAALGTIRTVLRHLDPSVPLSRAATIDDLVARSLQLPRSISLIVGAFAIVALVLSIVGIYGVMAHYVQQHAKDISIRVVLGGRPADVLRLIVGRGMAVVVGGVTLGLFAAFAMTRLIATLLFGIGATDAATFAGAALLMLATALVACVKPARRAVTAPPAAVLRME
jgi:putative ABC transport system permease protein